MARCGCASDQCGCTFVAGNGVVVTGAGTRSNPYVLEAISPTASPTGDANGRFSGEMVAFGGSAPPSGWLICDGSIVSRAVYSGLFDAIGTTYGAGNGTTTFALPDSRGKVLMGVSSTHPRGEQGGDETVVLTNSQMPRHGHGDQTGEDSPDHAHLEHSEVWRNVGGSAFDTINTSGNGLYTGTSSVGQAPRVSTDGVSARHRHSIALDGNNEAHTNLQPYLVVNHIIKT